MYQLCHITKELEISVIESSYIFSLLSHSKDEFKHNINIVYMGQKESMFCPQLKKFTIVSSFLFKELDHIKSNCKGGGVILFEDDQFIIEK